MAAANGAEGVAIYSDYRKMLQESGAEAVSVGVPNAMHRPIAVDCLNAGVHVLCEKPLSVTAREGQKIADAAAKNNRKCMVGQVNRFRADSRFLKTRITKGDLGALYYAHTGWLRKRGIPGFGGWFTTKEMSGGGPLIDIGVHMLDIAWWLCGCPQPLTVSGTTRAAFGPRGKGAGNWGIAGGGTFDVEDFAAALIRCEGGITINVEVSWAIHSRKDSMWCQIFGEEGGAEWGENAAIFRDIENVPTTLSPELGASDPWRGQCEHFVQSILNDTTPDPDVRQGVQMMKMLEAVYKSAESGREVVIK
jgi:predicted dehydrogenase